MNDHDRLDDVRSALAGLGEDDREVLLLTYWEGLTSDQVATVVGAGPATTRKRIQRARQRLAGALEVGGAIPTRATSVAAAGGGVAAAGTPRG